MKISPFAVEDLGAVLACRTAQGRTHAAKLDDTLRASKALADVANAVGRRMVREFGADAPPRLTAARLLEAAQRWGGRPDAATCGHARELVDVLERYLPGNEARTKLGLVAHGFSGRRQRLA